MRLAERYRLDEPIGRGGMGEVWRGWDEVLERPVAVKVLQDAAARSPESAARFALEARTAARVGDRYVAAVYDFGSDDERAFLVMELVEGRTLAEQLKAGGPSSPAAVASIAAQAAAGLAAAHAKDVIHRDIKPSNLLLDHDGTVKIVDFGIASGPSGETTAPMDEPGRVTGTSLYLAPEAALGRPSCAAGDVYSLGCALYELLTGRPPFTGDSALAVICQHVDGRPAAPNLLRPDVPAPFADYLLRMLAKAPEHRPTARQVADWFGNGSWREETAAPALRPLPVAESAASPAPPVPRRRFARHPLAGRGLRGLVGAAAAAVPAVYAEPAQG